jgi:hypothetical protein
MQEEKQLSRKDICKLLHSHFPDHMPIWGFLERTVKDAEAKEANRTKQL